MPEQVELPDENSIASMWEDTVSNVLRQQWLQSKVWAVVSCATWALFIVCFSKLTLHPVWSWQTAIGFILSFVLGIAFTTRVAPLQIGGHTNATTTASKG